MAVSEREVVVGEREIVVGEKLVVVPKCPIFAVLESEV